MLNSSYNTSLHCEYKNIPQFIYLFFVDVLREFLFIDLSREYESKTNSFAKAP